MSICLVQKAFEIVKIAGFYCKNTDNPSPFFIIPPPKIPDNSSPFQYHHPKNLEILAHFKTTTQLPDSPSPFLYHHPKNLEILAHFNISNQNT